MAKEQLLACNGRGAHTQRDVYSYHPNEKIVLQIDYDSQVQIMIFFTDCNGAGAFFGSFLNYLMMLLKINNINDYVVSNNQR